MDPNDRESRVTGWTGWVVFASVVLMIQGVIQFFYGLGGIMNQSWYVYTNNAAYVLSTNAWGWSMLVLGVVLFFTGLLLMSGNAFGRVMGAIFATLSLIANIGFFPAAPVWSIIAIVIDALVLYAIVAHGSEMKAITEV